MPKVSSCVPFRRFCVSGSFFTLIYFVQPTLSSADQHFFINSLVQHLKVRGYNNIRTGIRMVSMALEKPIPLELTIASFSGSVKYQGQPKCCFVCQSFGHFGRQSPKSTAKRDRLTTTNKNNDPAPPCQDSGLPNTATVATTTLPDAAAGEPSVQNVNVTSRLVDVGASTSRDYVNPSLVAPPSQTAMDILSRPQWRTALLRCLTPPWSWGRLRSASRSSSHHLPQEVITPTRNTCRSSASLRRSVALSA